MRVTRCSEEEAARWRGNHCVDATNMAVQTKHILERTCIIHMSIVIVRSWKNAISKNALFLSLNLPAIRYLLVIARACTDPYEWLILPVRLYLPAVFQTSMVL
jgi:hypothetical protein